MTVQCPYCELTFASRSELDWHVREDHPHEPPVDRSPLASGPGEHLARQERRP